MVKAKLMFYQLNGKSSGENGRSGAKFPGWFGKYFLRYLEEGLVK
jgi:hypothetical protein